MVDPWLTEKHVDRKKNDGWPNPRGFTKGVRFVWIKSDFGACVSVFTACWPNGKNDFDKSVRIVWIIWYGFSVNPPFGQLEVYVFGQHAVKTDTQAPKSDLIHTKRTPFVKPRGFGQPSFFFRSTRFSVNQGSTKKWTEYFHTPTICYLGQYLSSTCQKDVLYTSRQSKKSPLLACNAFHFLEFCSNHSSATHIFKYLGRLIKSCHRGLYWSALITNLVKACK